MYWFALEDGQPVQYCVFTIDHMLPGSHLIENYTKALLGTGSSQGSNAAVGRMGTRHDVSMFNHPQPVTWKVY